MGGTNCQLVADAPYTRVGATKQQLQAPHKALHPVPLTTMASWAWTCWGRDDTWFMVCTNDVRRVLYFSSGDLHRRYCTTMVCGSWSDWVECISLVTCAYGNIQQYVGQGLSGGYTHPALTLTHLALTLTHLALTLIHPALTPGTDTHPALTLTHPVLTLTWHWHSPSTDTHPAPTLAHPVLTLTWHRHSLTRHWYSPSTDTHSHGTDTHSHGTDAHLALTHPALTLTHPALTLTHPALISCRMADLMPGWDRR